MRLILPGLDSLLYRFAPIPLLRAMGQLPRLTRHPEGRRRAEDLLDAGVEEILGGRDPAAGKRWIAEVKHAVPPEMRELCANYLFEQAAHQWDAATPSSTGTRGNGSRVGSRLRATLMAGSHLAPEASPPGSLLRAAVRFPEVRDNTFAREVLRRHGPPEVLLRLAERAPPGEFRRILFSLATHDLPEATRLLHEAGPFQASALSDRDLEMLIDGESAVASLELRRALAEARKPDLSAVESGSTPREDQAAREA